jgi:predicted  nucleic acid-binding Zn-ribbon protein
VSDDESGITLTVEVTRGTDTDDRDKLRAKVEARDVDQLERRVEAVKERMETWADDLREIQPVGTRLAQHDDQSTLGEAES